MPASNLFMNWTGITVTPPTPAVAITIDEVTDVEVDRGGEVKKWYADGSVFPKALAHRNKTRKITIKGGAIGKLSSVPEGTPCTVVATLNDYLNGTGSGALTMTAVNAVVTNNPFKGQNSEYATGDLEFECFSADGTTDPVTFVAAT